MGQNILSFRSMQTSTKKNKQSSPKSMKTLSSLLQSLSLYLSLPFSLFPSHRCYLGHPNPVKTFTHFYLLFSVCDPLASSSSPLCYPSQFSTMLFKICWLLIFQLICETLTNQNYSQNCQNKN